MKSILSILFVVVATTSMWAQEVSVSAKVNEIFSMLPLECKNQVSTSSENVFECEVRDEKVDIKIIFNSSGQLTHIGLNLFSFDKNLIFSPEVLAFIERSVLDYLLIDDIDVVKKKIAEDKIDLSLNGFSLGDPGFSSIKMALPVLQAQYDFAIQYDGLFYTAVFRKPFGEFVMQFPGNINIVTGMDKKEYGEYICTSLKSFESSGVLPSFQVDTKFLKNYKDNIRVSVGDSYFKSITSSKYYKTNESGDTEILFSSDYALESFANIFLVPFSSNENIDLRINHKTYGDETLRYNISLADFLLFFEDEFEFYFGIEDNEGDVLSGTLILYNKGLNFINLLTVKTSKKGLFGESPVIDANFYTSIPSDNIKNLFAEFDDDSNF